MRYYEVCVCCGCMLCCISVYQCDLWNIVQVCVFVGTGGLCSPGCGRGVCSGGSWWRFKVLGVAIQHLMLLMMGVCTHNMSS